MAHVSRLSDYNRGGVVGETMQEGLAVVMTQSGVRNELPVLMKAGANAMNAGIVIKSPDDFSRPTDELMYTAPGTRVVNFNSGFSEPIHTRTVYDVGKSTLWNPTLVSGELATMQRGGTYAIPSGTYTDSDNIRVPGNQIAVGAGGVWVYTSGANAVGVVEEYQPANDTLVITLWH